MLRINLLTFFAVTGLTFAQAEEPQQVDNAVDAILEKGGKTTGSMNAIPNATYKGTAKITGGVMVFIRSEAGLERVGYSKSQAWLRKLNAKTHSLSGKAYTGENHQLQKYRPQAISVKDHIASALGGALNVSSATAHLGLDLALATAGWRAGCSGARYWTWQELKDDANVDNVSEVLGGDMCRDFSRIVGISVSVFQGIYEGTADWGSEEIKQVGIELLNVDPDEYQNPEDQKKIRKKLKELSAEFMIALGDGSRGILMIGDALVIAPTRGVADGRTVGQVMATNSIEAAEVPISEVEFWSPEGPIENIGDFIERVKADFKKDQEDAL